jgi:fructose-1,6-bisphosphatase/inositol monophosphatase family enzyme
MTHADAGDIISVLRAAGQRALTHFRHVTPTIKANRTYVTQADIEVQAFLREALERRFPDDGIIGEEDDLAKTPRHGDRYWVIDPIDGTASFVRGFPEWGIAVGLLTPRRAIGGFFYLPCTNDLFYARPDGSVWRNDDRLMLPRPEPESREAVLLAGARIHQRYHIDPAYGGKIRSLGSTIAHLCYVAGGSADAAFVPRVPIWDLAAGLAVVLLNGGVAEYLDGAPVALADLLQARQSDREMLVGHPDAVAWYRQWITIRRNH